jgi:hypothetical protein
MCLSCSGVHRGLGVHISFIRSITMDAFKGAELARMAAGGNKPFQDFFNTHASNTKDSRTFEASSIQERYDSEAGDEWKERLSCKVEGREFDKSNLPKRLPKKENTATNAPLGGRGSASGSRSQTPLGKTRGNDVRSGPRSAQTPCQLRKSRTKPTLRKWVPKTPTDQMASRPIKAANTEALAASPTIGRRTRSQVHRLSSQSFRKTLLLR